MLLLVFLISCLAASTVWSATKANASSGSSRKSGSDLQRHALAVHNSAIVIDTHADTPGRFVDENFDLGSDAGSGHIDLEKIRKGHLGAEFFSIWVDPIKYKGGYVPRALAMIDAVYEQVRRHPRQMVMAYSSQDILRARRGPRKRLATLIGIEGGHAIENDIRILRTYYRLGARYMTLSWMNSNEWADSSGDIENPNVAHHNGLSPFGKEVIREMNRMGMMVDVSHVSDKTFWDVLETTKAPIIASHSSARALNDHPRNLSDEMLKAIAKNGGVVQVNFASFFLDQKYLDAQKAQSSAVQKALKDIDEKYKDAPAEAREGEREKIRTEWASKLPRPPFSSLIDHIDHIAKVAGVDHVGLGSDFDGIDSAPEGMDSAADLPRITQALMARGYSEQDMRKILGGNLLRVFAQVERVSADMKKAEILGRAPSVTKAE